MQNKMISSTKRMWEKPKFSLEAFKGVQDPSTHFCLIRWPKYSIHKMKMYGDKGSPCLMPLVGSKGSKAPPFTKMAVLGDVMQLIIILRIFGGN